MPLPDHSANWETVEWSEVEAGETVILQVLRTIIVRKTATGRGRRLRVGTRPNGDATEGQWQILRRRAPAAPR